MADDNLSRRRRSDHDGAAAVISTVGEEIVRIVSPVSACMLIVVVLVTALSSPSSPSPFSSISSIFSSPSPSDDDAGDPSFWDNLRSAAIDSAAFIAFVTALTFLLVLLFYLRCTGFLKSYMAFSSFVVLAFLGGEISLAILRLLSLPVDCFTFSILLFNFAVAGVLAVFMSRMPIVVTQGYLVIIGVLVAYWFTLLPEWTTWALLVGMAIYDLAAVLLPGGPLRLLVELAISRDEAIPALVYEARPVQPHPGAERRGLWRNSAIPGSNLDSGDSSWPPARLVVPEEGTSVAPPPASSGLRAPLIQHGHRHEPERRREEEDEEEAPEGVRLSSSGAIKLGLGDFIFYSVLVGRAALYDLMTVYACYLAIIAGLGVTLLLLAVYRKALPALPVSIMLGLLFYAFTRTLLEVFVVQCSMNLLLF